MCTYHCSGVKFKTTSSLHLPAPHLFSPAVPSCQGEEEDIKGGEVMTAYWETPRTPEIKGKVHPMKIQSLSAHPQQNSVAALRQTGNVSSAVIQISRSTEIPSLFEKRLFFHTRLFFQARALTSDGMSVNALSFTATVMSSASLVYLHFKSPDASVV